MVRVLLSILLPLLLPTAAFFLYAWYRTRRAAAAGAEPQAIDVPWSWLCIAGLLLAIVSVTVNVIYMSGEKGTHYEPAHMENGKIVPGRVSD